MWTRNVQEYLLDACADTPVVVIQGPRQCGKTTLAKQVPGTFVTLDDDATLEAATVNPASFVKGHSGCLIIDEVQRAPRLFLAIKAEVDRHRRPGMFLLTGSTNVLLLPKIADSLAGRHEVVPLWPLSVGEELGCSASFIDWAFSDDFAWAGDGAALDAGLLERGGFPEAVSRPTPGRRAKWFENYIDSVVTKDIRDLANIQNVALLPRLLRSLARQTAQAVNINTLSAETGLQRTTAERYVDLLETVFLWKPIEAWRPEEGPRVARKSKVTFIDSGILNAILPDLPLEAKFDTFVTMELVKQATWSTEQVQVKTLRSTQSWSLPVVLESRQGKVVGIALTAGQAPPPEALARLEFLRSLAGEKFHRGIVLHAGDEWQRLNDRIGSAPVSALWAPPG